MKRGFEKLSDDELRALELDENVQRLDLDDYDAGKQRAREIEAKEREIAAEVSAQVGPKGGRPPGGDREVARRLGISRQEIQRTRQHMATTEEFPVFQGLVSE